MFYTPVYYSFHIKFGKKSVSQLTFCLIFSQFVEGNWNICDDDAWRIFSYPCVYVWHLVACKLGANSESTHRFSFTLGICNRLIEYKEHIEIGASQRSLEGNRGQSLEKCENL